MNEQIGETKLKHSFLVGKQHDLTNNITNDINLSTRGALGSLERQLPEGDP